MRFADEDVAALLTSDGKPPRTFALVALDGGVHQIARTLGDDGPSDQATIVGRDFDG